MGPASTRATPDLQEDSAGKLARRRATWAEGGDRALGRVFSRCSGCLRACGQQQEHHRWSLAVGIEVGDRARVSPAELGSRASEEHLSSHGRSTQIARSWGESARHLPCRCDVNGSVTKGVEVGKDRRSDGDDAGLDVVTGTAIVLNAPQNGKHGLPRESGVCAHGADVELNVEADAASALNSPWNGKHRLLQGRNASAMTVWDCAGGMPLTSPRARHGNCTGFFFKKKTTAEPKTMAMWSGTEQNGHEQRRVANELLKNLWRLNSAAVTRRQVVVCAGYLLFLRWCE